jgi:hypothetical protein
MTLLLRVSAPIKVGETRGRSGCAETRHPRWGLGASIQSQGPVHRPHSFSVRPL